MSDKIGQDVAALFGYYLVFNPGLEKAVVRLVRGICHKLEKPSVLSTILEKSQPTESLSTDKIKHDVATLLPCMCNHCDYNERYGAENWNCPRHYRPAIVAWARGLVAELGEQLECDRTAVAHCLTNASRALSQRNWLTEGRGSYEWDDDKYRDEFGYAISEFAAAIEPLRKIAADWSNCPRTPEGIAAARIDLKAELAALRQENERLKIAAHDWRNRVAPEMQMLGDQRAAAIRNSEQLKAERDAALRGYTANGFEGWPCPGCKWDKGKLLERCGLHKQIDAAYVALEWWTGCESSEAVKKALAAIKAREDKE